jgi:hypothetical protein
MAPSKELSLSIRAVIIAYRFDLGWEYKAIAKRLLVNHEAIKSLCQRVQKRSDTKEERRNSRKLHILLNYIDNEPGRGRPTRATPGSAIAMAVRRGLEEYPNEERPIAANQGIQKRQALGELHPNIKPLDRKQIIHIAEDTEHCQADPYQPKPLKRKRVLDKPELNDIDRETRLEYCDVVDKYYKRDYLLIMCDEKGYSFGGSKKGTHVTAPEGETTYTSRARKRFKIEQWAAGCAGDTSITRPHVCWDVTIQNQSELADKLAVANQRLRSEVEARRWSAQIEGTPEWEEWRRRNAEIRTQNTKDSLDGLKPTRRLVTVNQLYPFEELRPTGKKGGLNFVWYAFEVLEKHLFPYYQAIQQANKDKHVVIVEDNDPSHLKARKLLAADITRLQIEFAPHPPNSPDFNLIETVQKYHQKSLESYSANITSAAKQVKVEAEGHLKEAWQSKDMDEVWQDRASNYALKLIANRCRIDKGGNHFADDINTSKAE